MPDGKLQRMSPSDRRDCPVCMEIRRDHSQECEMEATALIRRAAFTIVRRDFDAPISTADARQEWRRLDSIIVASRKRQAHLARMLDEHTNAMHLKRGSDGINGFHGFVLFLPVGRNYPGGECFFCWSN